MAKIKRWVLLLSCCQLIACFPIKSIFLGAPDNKDSQRFAFNNVESAPDCFEFPRAKDTTIIKVNDWTSDLPFFVDLKTLLKGHATRGFILIQQDSILFEYYADNLNAQSYHPSYSVAKCFISTLIGIAIEDALIGSVDDFVLQYIPELSRHQYAKTLTIEHLLNHTSGIKADLLLDALLYYGDNLSLYLNRLEFCSLPGLKQHYLNVNTQLLALVLERVTKTKVSRYFEQKIWQKIGACSAAEWSADTKNKTDKAFCCFNATLRDYAKFGRLYLNKGTWEAESIFSKKWYHQSLRRDTLQGSSFNYNYNWHIGLNAYEDFMAIGLYKQHIYICPTSETIMVLLLDKEPKLKAERVNWWYVFRQIVDQSPKSLAN